MLSISIILAKASEKFSGLPDLDIFAWSARERALYRGQAGQGSELRGSLVES